MCFAVTGNADEHAVFMEVNAQQLYKFQSHNSLSFNKCLFCYLDNENTPFFSIKKKTFAIQETEPLF